MKYLSLFTGIGGFELGIQQAYEVYNRPQSKKGSKTYADKRKPAGKPKFNTGPVCVGYSEIDKYAVQIYQKQFPHHENYGDITKIKANKLPDFDLLVGGFPCQSFSIAGHRKGFADTRGTLFFDIARILKFKKPRNFVLENVKGLLNHENGSTFRTIITTLTDLGYDCEWQVLNSKDFGVPQNRERVFIVGHLRGKSRPKVFPFFADAGVFDETNEAEKTQSQTYTAKTIRTKQGGRSDDNFVVGTLRTHKDGEGFREMKSKVSPTLNARAREDGSQQPIIFDLKTKGSKTRRGGISNKGEAKTLDHNCYQGLMCSRRIRRLTPVECERLQGFADNWTDGLSDTQRYKCCGNAVTVNVVQAIIERLIYEL